MLNKQKLKRMLKLSKINIGNSIQIDDYSIKAIEYQDKDYSGLITIYFDGDYEKIDDSFDHEFGTEEGCHYELKNVVIEFIEFDAIYKVGTEEEASVELVINDSPIFEDLQAIIEDLNVIEW